jgi:hypothetical protein
MPFPPCHVLWYLHQYIAKQITFVNCNENAIATMKELALIDKFFINKDIIINKTSVVLKN